MANIFRIPANSKAYLFATVDEATGKFDVTKLAVVPRPDPFPTPWGYWKLEEESGNRIDSTGNGHTLTPDGYAHSPTQATGKVGNCAEFVGDGYSDSPHFQISDSFPLGTDQNFTVAFWLKSTRSDTGSMIRYFYLLAVDYADWWNQIDFELWCGNPYEVDGLYCWATAGYYDEEYNWHAVEAATDPNSYTLEENTWHFICFYYDGGGIYLEVDNALVASGLGKHGMTVQPDMLRLGFPDNSQTVHLDELGIWDVALTQAQREYLWNNGGGRSLY